MNIIAVCGSPRRGNTEFALKRFLTKAEELGHKVELVLLSDKRIQSCRGCLECEQTGSCRIVDDMSTIVDRLSSNDLLVFATPSYFNSATGIMKNFIDRLYVCFKNGKLSDKKLINIVIGNDIKSKDRTVSFFEYLAEDFKMSLIGCLCLEAHKNEDLKNNENEIEKIDNFVSEILK